MALFTCTAKLDPGAHNARCAWAMAVHHAVGISCRQRHSGYRPSRVNITAQGLSTPDPSLSPTNFSIRRGRATTTHYTHHQVSLMVARNTTLVLPCGCPLGQPVRQASALACEWSVCHPKEKEKRKKKKESYVVVTSAIDWLERLVFAMSYYVSTRVRR